MATTIEITDAQREALEDEKLHDKEPLKDVIGRLLDGGDDGLTADTIQTDHAKADPAQLDRIEQAVETIESRTGSIESTLEGLQR